jgi:hypothetical protein
LFVAFLSLRSILLSKAPLNKSSLSLKLIFLFIFFIIKLIIILWKKLVKVYFFFVYSSFFLFWLSYKFSWYWFSIYHINQFIEVCFDFLNFLLLYIFLSLFV